MRTQHLGPDEVLVAGKIELDTDLHFRQVAETIDRVETSVRAICAEAKLIYLEPDITRPVPA